MQRPQAEDPSPATASPGDPPPTGATDPEEKRFRRLVEALNGIVWEADAETLQFTYVNGRAEQILGFPAARWIEDPGFWHSRLHPEDAARVAAQRAGRARARADHALTYRMLRADGGTVWLHDQATVSVRGAGAVLHGLMVDAGPQVETARALDEARRRNALILDASPDGLLGLDAAGRITFDNAAARRMLGHAPGALAGRSARTLLAAPDQDGGPDCPIARTLRDGRTRTVLDGSFRRRDGSTFPVEFTVGATGTGEEDRGAALSFRDVTEQQRHARLALHSRRQLRASEERHQSLYDLVPVAIWEEDWTEVIARLNALRDAGVTDIRGFLATTPAFLEEAIQTVQVENVNRASIEMFKAPDRETLMRSGPDILFDHNSKSIFAASVAAVWDGETEYESTNILRKLDGELIHVLVRIALPRLDGSTTRTIISEMDITEARQATERFRLVTQATKDVIWDYDMVRNVLWWSDGLRSTFGLDPDAMSRGLTPWLGRVHPEDIARLSAQVRTVASGRSDTWSEEYRLRRGDGGYAVVRGEGTVIRDDTAKPVRMIGSLIDVTAQKLLEDQVRQSQRLDSVGQLTGGIAHDFNNILTILLSSVELLQERIGRDATAAELAQTALRTIERGSDLTSRLLAFARRQPLDPRPVDVADLAREMGRLLQRTFGAHYDIRIGTAGASWRALIDAGQLENAILNLCINARDAMPEGGTLRICVTDQLLDPRHPDWGAEMEPGDYVGLTVSDTGQGIAAEDLTRVFDPFFTTKSPGKGSGLGLSMVHGFVNQSRGHVRLSSEPGRGTSVRLYLPRARPAAAEEASPAEDEVLEGGSEPVLLVEDDDQVRAHVALQLDLLGYPVTAVPDAAAALDLLRAEGGPFRLLYTDILMPGGMNGIDLARAAQQLRPGLRVLFSSGYAEEAVVEEARQMPRSWFLPKPFRREALARAVRTVLATTR